MQFKKKCHFAGRDEGLKAVEYPLEAENLALNNENEYEDDDEYEVMHRF